MGAWGIKALERDEGLDVLDILKNEYVPEHPVMDLGEMIELPAGIIHFFTYNFGTDISHKLFGVNSTLFLFNLNICCMAVFLWLFFVREQTIRQLHCRICSMRFIFEILPNVTK